MDEKNILISIIIPVYNVEDYLPECIESILKQTEQRFEIILVDDGSKDRSGKICDEYAEKNKKIKVFHQENQGVSAARNLGIKSASGQYLVFIDSDDWIDRDYLQILLKHMAENGMAVCDLNINEERKDKAETVILSKEDAQISVLSCNGIQGFPVTKMFDRRILISKNIFFDIDISLCEDVLFIMKYLKETSGDIVWCKQSPYHYRKTSDGVTNHRFQKHDNFSKKELTEIDAIERCKNYALDSKKVKNACKIRYTKAAVVTLRAMVANEYQDKKLYDMLLTYVRKHMFSYITSSLGVKSSKFSVLLCALSPKLELKIWNKYTESF